MIGKVCSTTFLLNRRGAFSLLTVGALGFLAAAWRSVEACQEQLRLTRKLQELKERVGSYSCYQDGWRLNRTVEQSTLRKLYEELSQTLEKISHYQNLEPAHTLHTELQKQIAVCNGKEKVIGESDNKTVLEVLKQGIIDCLSCLTKHHALLYTETLSNDNIITDYDRKQAEQASAINQTSLQEGLCESTSFEEAKKHVEWILSQFPSTTKLTSWKEDPAPHELKELFHFSSSELKKLQQRIPYSESAREALDRIYQIWKILVYPRPIVLEGTSSVINEVLRTFQVEKLMPAPSNKSSRHLLCAAACIGMGAVVMLR